MIVTSSASAARGRDPLDQQVVDLVQHVELAPDAVLPGAKPEPLGGAGVHLRQVEVAAQLERVVHALDDAGDVETDGGQLRDRPA